MRSRSSLPKLSGSMEEEAAAEETLQNKADAAAAVVVVPPSTKPRLVKQKMHLNDDSCLLDVPENTAIKPLSGDEPQVCTKTIKFGFSSK